MGYGYNVDEEAIQSMSTTANELQEAQELMKQYVANIQSAFEDNWEGLGAHAEDIRTLIEELEGLLNAGNAKILKLVLRLTKAMAIRIEHIEKNGYSSGGRSR